VPKEPPIFFPRAADSISAELLKKQAGRGVHDGYDHTLLKRVEAVASPVAPQRVLWPVFVN